MVANFMVSKALRVVADKLQNTCPLCDLQARQLSVISIPYGDATAHLLHCGRPHRSTRAIHWPFLACKKPCRQGRQCQLHLLHSKELSAFSGLETGLGTAMSTTRIGANTSI